MTYETVKLEHDGALAILTLNRPEKMNSLSDQLLADFRAAIDTCERDDSVRALIITGAGRAFSAGFDIVRGVNLVIGLQEHPQTFARTHFVIDDQDLREFGGDDHFRGEKKLSACR